jgi:hypothetical protein
LGYLIQTYYDPLIFEGHQQDFHNLAKELGLTASTRDKLFDFLKFQSFGTPLALEEILALTPWGKEIAVFLQESKLALQPKRVTMRKPDPNTLSLQELSGAPDTK